MKILHLSTFDIVGGAARAAYRIHHGLRNTGIDSWMLVQKRVSKDNFVIEPQTAVGKASGRVRSELNKLALHSYSSANISIFDPQIVPDRLLPRISQINSDIINLHWVSNGYLKPETLARINKPLVWTLMDMAPFTGGCHYTQGCERYTQTCGSCPQLGSLKLRDLSHHILQRKFSAWKNLNLTVVSPTQWLFKCAKSSTLFKDIRVEVIPFGLDIRKYKPINKQAAREVLNLPQNKKLILFGAVSAIKDHRKGFHLLQPALQILSQSSYEGQAEIVVFGSSEPSKPCFLGLPTHYLGHLSDDVSLALAYSAADVMVVPSVQEAFGQTASESLACGTPVVTFRETGVADIVDHQQNGYLATPFEVKDLADGIAWVLEDSERHLSLSHNARQKAIQEFSMELQAYRYKNLYEELIKQSLKDKHITL